MPLWASHLTLLSCCCLIKVDIIMPNSCRLNEIMYRKMSDMQQVLVKRCVCLLGCSVFSNSLQCQGLKSTSFLCAWDFPDKNIGVSYDPLHFCVAIVISPFSFLILLIWFFSLFFLMSLANGLSFIYLLKEPAFSFVDFCYSLLCFFFIYFCPNCFYFFPSTNPGVLHLFFF